MSMHGRLRETAMSNLYAFPYLKSQFNSSLHAMQRGIETKTQQQSSEKSLTQIINMIMIASIAINLNQII